MAPQSPQRSARPSEAVARLDVSRVWGPDMAPHSPQRAALM